MAYAKIANTSGHQKSDELHVDMLEALGVIRPLVWDPTLTKLGWEIAMALRDCFPIQEWPLNRA